MSCGSPLLPLAAKHLGGKQNPEASVEYEYSKSGQIVARTANGARQTYEYDGRGQLLAVRNADGTDAERYAYDKAGNMVKKKILRSGRAGAPRTPQSEDYITTTFTFDGANQLVSSTTDGVTTKYAYDAAGRLAKEGTKAYRYGYLNKVLSVTDDDTTRTYTYHADGQLASANCCGDGRAHTPGAPQTENFLWDGLALIQRGDEQFINEPHIGGGNPVVSSKGTSYFNDMLGTTLGAKTKGKKYSSAALTAFGERLDNADDSSPAIRSLGEGWFTGKPHVPGLGHAFLFRNYRASLAKWQTADPLGYPDGWNRLAYCEGDSLNFVDYGGAHRVPVSGNGYIFTLAGFGFSFDVQVWGECGGLEHPYISIQSDYYGNAVSFAIDDFSIIVSSFTITKQNHGWEHTISGGVSIWANFTILLELIYISTDENGNEESETITSSIRYGEFHCDHQKNIFE